MKNENILVKVTVIAEKYAGLVEKRIDDTEELSGQELRDIYDSIQTLGHIAATLERLNHIRRP